MRNERHYTQLQTILVLVTFFGVLYWFLHKPYLLIVAGCFAATGILFPPLAAIIHKGWMKLAEILGLISGSIILGLVFFIVITPLGLFYRKFRKPGFRFMQGGNSAFKERNHVFVKEDLENMW